MNGYFCDLLTIEDLARLLRRSPTGLARDVSRRKEMLPPFIRVGKTPLWPRHAVEEWMHRNASGEFPEGFRFFVPVQFHSAPQQPTLVDMLLACHGGNNERS